MAPKSTFRRDENILDVVSLFNKIRLMKKVCSFMKIGLVRCLGIYNLVKEELERFIYSMKVLKQIFSSSTKISVNLLFPIVTDLNCIHASRTFSADIRYLNEPLYPILYQKS